jgi:hypothetical protein
MIWLVFIELLLIISSAINFPFPVITHILLGSIIFGLALNNLFAIGKTEAPDRIKRIIKVTFGLTGFQGFLGIIIFINVNMVIIPFIGVVNFLHLVVSLTIISQASSVATAYDMWEEKEFN